MNSFSSNRVFNPLMTLVCIAAMLVIAAISILLLYGVFQFIEMFILDTSRHASQYVTQLVKSN